MQGLNAQPLNCQPRIIVIALTGLEKRLNEERNMGESDYLLQVSVQINAVCHYINLA